MSGQIDVPLDTQVTEPFCLMVITNVAPKTHASGITALVHSFPTHVCSHAFIQDNHWLQTPKGHVSDGVSEVLTEFQRALVDTCQEDLP